jgi:hypothetical protein
MWRDCDTNGDNHISYPEWLAFVAKPSVGPHVLKLEAVGSAIALVTFSFRFSALCALNSHGQFAPFDTTYHNNNNLTIKVRFHLPLQVVCSPATSIFELADVLL